MKYYLVTLKFDYGKIRILTTAENEQAAKEKVCAAEKCPLTAVINIHQHSGAGYMIEKIINVY